MKKRILSIITCLALCLSLLPAVSVPAAAADGDKTIMLGTGGISGWDSTNSYDYIYMGRWEAPDSYTTSGPIKWRVLDTKTNTGGSGLFLLSDGLFGKGGAGEVYFDNTDPKSNAWQDSDAQAWCKDFAGESGAEEKVFDAFTNAELGAVLDTTISDDSFQIISSTGTITFSASENILNGDKVFFLSAAEAENEDYGFTDDNARIAHFNMPGIWCLRSPIESWNTENVGAVSNTGIVKEHSVMYRNSLARPAFNLDLDSVLFSSAADNSGHNSSFTTPADYSGSEWKLTLKDENSFAEASVDKTAIAAGETLTVTHMALSSFGDAGYTNVTAMLTNSSGEILYYGSINNSTSATESTVTIPAGLTAGEYTLSVYGEDWNGENMTDYATGTPFTTTIHVHSWGADWSSDSTHHWHECDISGCPVTENSSKDDYAAHSADESTGDCVCGFNPLTVTVSQSPDSYTYGDPGVTLSAAVTRSDSGSAENATYAWSKNGEAISGETGSSITLTGLDAGSYTYTCTVTVDGYIMTGEVTVKVDKAPSNPNDPTVSATVGDKLNTVVITSSTEGTPGTWAWKSGNSWIHTRTYKADAVFTPRDSDNYLPAERTLTITAAPRAMTETNIALNENEREVTYDGGVKKPGVTVTYNDFAFTEDTDYTLTWPEDCVNVGDKIVTITPKADGGLTGGAVERTFSIWKASAPTVSCETAVVYNATKPVTVDLEPLLEEYLLESDEPTVGGLENTVLNITADGLVLSILPKGLSDPQGECKIWLTIENLNNYHDVFVELTVDITDKIPVTVNMDGVTLADKTYDGAAISYSGAATGTTTDGVYSGGFTYEWYSGDTKLTEAPKDAGTYKLRATVSDTANYVGYGEKTVAISPAAITVTAKNQSIYVGGTAPDLSSPALNTHYTVTGLVGSDTLGGTITMSYGSTPDTTKTGTYDILISGVTVPNETNYSGITFAGGTLTISTRPSSGGGGGYTPPSTPSTPPTQSVTVPISGDDNTIHVGASVSGDKAVVDEVDLSHLDTVIGDHVEDVGTVTIDFSNLDSSKPITTVEIPSDVVKQIADAVNDPTNDAHSFEVVLSNGLSIEFDAVALGEKAAQADGLDITISIENAKDAKPNQKQEAALKGRPAYEISVTSGGEHISDMGGQITVHAPYELQDGEHPRGIIVWYVDEDGKRERCETSYDNEKKRVNWKTDHLSLYMIDYDPDYIANCPKNESCPMYPFTDLDVGAWYHDGVHYAIENGLMNGTSTTEMLFSPEGITTRAQIVTILHRLEGSPINGQGKSGTFVDVPEYQWYTEAVEWAAAFGITSGTGDGTTFSPNDPITREQLAAFLYRYAQYKGYDVSVGEDTNILSYEDAFTVSEYAYPALQWACGAGIIGGMNSASGGMILDPQGSATRAQAATMLMRFCENANK